MTTHDSKINYRAGLVQWLAHLTCDPWMPVRSSPSPVKGSSCYIHQETLPSLLSTAWFQ